MDNKEYDDDDVRPFDSTMRTTLLGTDRKEVRSLIAQEEDIHMKIAMEESLRVFEKEEETHLRLMRLEQERIQEQEEKHLAELERVRKLRLNLGIIITRLRTIFSKDKIAVDLLAWIEWECTPTHDLTSFRPHTKHSIMDIRQWMSKNLNSSFVELLESSLSCL